MAITAFKISGVNKLNVDQAIDFIISKVLKIGNSDNRGSVAKCLNFPNYVYFSRLPIEEDLDLFPFEVQVFTLPEGYYKNNQDFKLEVPSESLLNGSIDYVRIYPGEIIVPLTPEIRLLLVPFVTAKLLIRQQDVEGALGMIPNGVWQTDNGDWQTGNIDWFTR